MAESVGEVREPQPRRRSGRWGIVQWVARAAGATGVRRLQRAATSPLRNWHLDQQHYKKHHGGVGRPWPSALLAFVIDLLVYPVALLVWLALRVAVSLEHHEVNLDTAPRWPLGFELAVHFLRTRPALPEVLTLDAIARLRRGFEKQAQPAPSSALVVPSTIGSCNAEWSVPKSRCGDVATQQQVEQHISSNGDMAVVLYLHGGGYYMGSPRTHRRIVGHIALNADCAVLALDYRLAPEHPFPAALDDAASAFRYLVRELSIDPSRIFIAGDSAGGGLSLALAATLRDKDEQLPAGAILLSPWADLTNSGASWTYNEPYDYLGPISDVHKLSAQYAGEHSLLHPLISPIHADFSGLPPLLIQAGAVEMLLDDARVVAAKARAAGVAVQLEEYPDMIHVFHLLGKLAYPHSRNAIASIAAFVHQQCGKSQ